MWFLALSVLLNLAGVAAAALALILLVRAHGSWQDRLLSQRGLGALAILAAGCMLAAGGQYKQARLLYEPARQAENLARLQLTLADPVSVLHLCVSGADSFAGRPSTCVLQLCATSKAGQSLTSEVAVEQMKLMPRGSNEQGIYAIAWLVVLEGATTGEGRALAARMRTVNDFRQLERLELLVVDRAEKPGPAPDYLAIVVNDNWVMPAFSAARVSKGAVRRQEEWITAYTDAMSPAARISGEVELAPARPTIGGPLDGLLGMSLLLLAAGIGLVLVGPANPPRTIVPWAAPTFVWGIWVLMVLGATLFVGKYGSRIPYSEEWHFVPWVTGDEPVTLRFFWEQLAEHRLVLYKALALSLWKPTGFDARPGMYFSVLALAALSFAMIRAAKVQRGWTSYADAFFPLALLQWELYWVGLWANGTCVYAIPMLVAGTLLIIIVRRGTQLTLGTAVLAGICLALLPLCGAYGIVFMPALMLWFGYSGILLWRSAYPSASQESTNLTSGAELKDAGHQTVLAAHRQARRTSLLIGVFALLALLIVFLYFVVDYTKNSYVPSSPSLQAVLRTSLEFLTAGMGPEAAKLWPFSGVMMVILILLTTGALVVALWRKKGPDRSRVLALLFFVAAVATCALAVGWGRGSFGPGWCLANNPVLPALALCCTYFVWGIWPSGTLARLAQFGLFTLVGLSVLLHLPTGLNQGKYIHAVMEAFERDLQDGVPPYMLVARHRGAISGIVHDGRYLADRIRMLHRAGMGPFRDLHEDPPFRELSLSLTPIDMNAMTWAEGTGQGTGPESYVTFDLPRPMFVGGIRLKHSQPDYRSFSFRVFWRRSDKSSFPKEAQFVCFPYIPDPLTIYIGDTIDQIRIYPADDKPFTYSLSEIVLLIPETEGRAESETEAGVGP